MKMQLASWSSACLLLVFSIALQGCDFGPAEEAQEQRVERQIRKDFTKVERAIKKDVTGNAKCHGGHFHCDGGWREWCNRMKKRCTKKDCSPMCAWTCDSPKCNQECGPVCNQPACSTRCKGFNTDSCKMKCGKPMCKVVCPKHFCPSQDCAACKTECGKPACKMECGVDEQPCRHVCAQPVCKWECKNPSLCPKPKCAMKCKKEPECMQTMHMFSKVPPLEPGETEIVTAEAGPSPAPAALFQSTAGNMRVNFTRMDNDGRLHNGQVNLAMIQESADSMETSWTRMVTEVKGQVTESEASCTSGKFHCQGDEKWCAEQEKYGCGQPMFLRQRSQPQNHLQP